ncbi:MAG: hypothetical protein ACE141_01140 [Bryobacteraceae bacterium]
MRICIAFLSLIWLFSATVAAEDKTPQQPGAGKKTPFGTVKLAEKTGEEKPNPPATMRAFEEGDTVRFERQTPFGVKKWSKKKSELDETEQAVVERERRKKEQP